MSAASWPDLAIPGWQDTCRTVQLFSQLVGKTRIALAPRLNHWWHITLRVSARGLLTPAMPCGERLVEVELDLRQHLLEIRASDGARASFPLGAGPIAAFHARYLEALRSVGVTVKLNPIAAEIEETIRLDRDETPRPYDRAWVTSLHGALVQAQRLLAQFRSGFSGKASPVQFFWGSFDLAVTRFSGRRAPLYTGHAPHCPDGVMQEAYSHEVSSAGFWPGDAQHPALFYSYAYPAPPGLAQAGIRPPAGRFDPGLGEFVLPYDDVRRSSDPDDAVLAFLQTTYAAAADLAAWPRRELEV
jgi:hypothetical protein